MAPITSFIKISNHSVLPVRIFINRREVSRTLKQHVVFEAAVSSADTRSHRALVRLKSTAPIYLSNAQISQLCDAVKDELIHVLLIATFESLKLSSQSKDKEVVRIVMERSGWKVRLDTTMDFVLSVRSGKLFDDTPVVMIRRPREMVGEQQEVVFNEEGQDDDDDVIRIPDEGEVVPLPDHDDGDDNEGGDRKKVQKYDYKSMNVLGKGIRLEVLQIPRH